MRVTPGAAGKGRGVCCMAPGCSCLLLARVQSPSPSTAGIFSHIPNLIRGCCQLLPPAPLLPAPSPGAGRGVPALGNPATHVRQCCSSSDTATFSSKGMSRFSYLSTRKVLHLRSLLSLHEARVTRLGPAPAGREMPLPHAQLPVPWGLRCFLGCAGQEETPQSNSAAKAAA